MTFPLDFDDPPEAPGPWLPLSTEPPGQMMEVCVVVCDAAGADQGERRAIVHIMNDDPHPPFDTKKEAPRTLRVVSGRWRALTTAWVDPADIRYVTREQLTPALVNVDSWPHVKTPASRLQD